jgi:hypothetical protein
MLILRPAVLSISESGLVGLRESETDGHPALFRNRHVATFVDHTAALPSPSPPPSLTPIIQIGDLREFLKVIYQALPGIQSSGAGLMLSAGVRV